MVDEATDAANDEQLAVSIRYVKPNTRCIEERFLAFSECLTGVTGNGIADHILRLLGDWQLLPSNIRGQTYDGAGAMAGKSRGQQHISKKLFQKQCTHTVLHMPSTCAWSNAVQLLRSEI